MEKKKKRARLIAGGTLQVKEKEKRLRSIRKSQKVEGRKRKQAKSAGRGKITQRMLRKNETSMSMLSKEVQEGDDANP